LLLDWFLLLSILLVGEFLDLKFNLLNSLFEEDFFKEEIIWVFLF